MSMLNKIKSIFSNREHQLLVCNDNPTKEKELKDKIWKALVNDDYIKNDHLQHFHFIIDGERHVFGIISLVSIYGDNMFKRIAFEKSIMEEEKMTLISSNNSIKKTETKKTHLRLVK